MKNSTKIALLISVIAISSFSAWLAYSILTPPTTHGYRATSLNESGAFTPYLTLQDHLNYTSNGIGLTVDSVVVKCPKLSITLPDLVTLLGLKSVNELYTNDGFSRVFFGTMIGKFNGLYGVIFMSNGNWYMNDGLSKITADSIVTIAVELT
jgi:hypothetical protein